MMRRILFDYAKARRREKRGEIGENLPLEAAALVASEGKGIDLVALDEASPRFAGVGVRHEQIVELRHFTGSSIDETVESLGISPATVKSGWKSAKARLRHKITRAP